MPVPATRRLAGRALVFAAALLAGTLAAPVAEADGWRDRGHRHGWDRGHDRAWREPVRPRREPPGVDLGSAALGAIVGLGAGVVLGTMLAPQAAPPGVPR